MRFFKPSSINFIRQYKHRSYFFRNFILILLLLFAPFMVIVTLYYNSSRESIYNDIKTSNYNLLQNMSSMSAYILKNSLNIGYSLSVQNSCKYYCYKGIAPYFSASVESLYDSIDTLESTNELIDSINIYSSVHDSFLSENHSITSESADYEHSIVQKAIKEYGSSPAYFHSIRYNIYPHLITVYVPVTNDTNAKNIIGAVFVQLNFEYIRKFLKLPDDTQYYILNNNDTLLYSNNINDMKNKQDIEEMVSSLDLEPDSQIILGSSLYTYIKGESLNNSYLMITSLDNYQERFSKMPFFFLIYVSIAFLLSMFYALLILNHTSKPITTLLNIFSSNIEHEKYKSEEEFLTCKIIDAIDKNDALQTLLAQRMKLLHNTQLMALQTQINPHFLYNTLENIKWNAMDLTNGENCVSTAIQDLGQLLRYSLTMTPRYVPLSTERQYLELYLKIVNARFEKPILMSWDYDEEINNCKIPRLFLQPVIENSIQHGLRSVSRDKIISIEAYLNDSFLYINIHDNGIGMNQEETDALNKYLNNIDQTAEQHIGLLNLAQRIHISYGSDCYIKISSKPNIGTTVQIKIQDTI